MAATAGFSLEDKRPHPDGHQPFGHASLNGDGHDLATLRSELRRERARGKAGHWAYDLARHLKLARQVKTMQAQQTSV